MLFQMQIYAIKNKTRNPLVINVFIYLKQV